MGENVMWFRGFSGLLALGKQSLCNIQICRPHSQGLSKAIDETSADQQLNHFWFSQCAWKWKIFKDLVGRVWLSRELQRAFTPLLLRSTDFIQQHSIFLFFFIPNDGEQLEEKGL